MDENNQLISDNQAIEGGRRRRFNYVLVVVVQQILGIQARKSQNN